MNPNISTLNCLMRIGYKRWRGRFPTVCILGPWSSGIALGTPGNANLKLPMLCCISQCPRLSWYKLIRLLKKVVLRYWWPFTLTFTSTWINELRGTMCWCVRFQDCWSAMAKDAQGLFIVYNADAAENNQKELERWWSSPCITVINSISKLEINEPPYAQDWHWDDWKMIAEEQCMNEHIWNSLQLLKFGNHPDSLCVLLIGTKRLQSQTISPTLHVRSLAWPRMWICSTQAPVSDLKISWGLNVHL